MRKMDQCVLVAEDSSCIRQLMVRSLQVAGYCVLEASDGMEALELSNNYSGHIDLLITDINMPRMGGHELARLVKESRPSILVVVVSTELERDFAPHTAEYVLVLTKPVKHTTLIDKIKGLLRAFSAQQASLLLHLGACREFS
jgi:CheY-like chemotaxis protein